MEKIEFDENKTYFLIFNREGHELVFTAHNIKQIGTLLSFTDKFGQQQIFDISLLKQAQEVKT